jgi:hypothetical protein
MLIGGGICEFTTRTVLSRPSGAQISPPLARASDGLLLRTIAELSEGLPILRELALLVERSHDQSACGGSGPGEARFPSSE